MGCAVKVGLLSMCLVGCFGVNWQTTYSSVPTLVPSETWSQTEDGLFATAGMKVRVRADNDVIGRGWGAGVVFLIPIPLAPAQPGAKPTRPFRIHLTFDAATGDFTFDLGRVTLASEQIPPMGPRSSSGAPRTGPGTGCAGSTAGSSTPTQWSRSDECLGPR